MGLSLLQTVSAVEREEDPNKTIYVENGTESVELSCGPLPENPIAIAWRIKQSDGWKKILKIYTSGPSEQYDTDKYGISESVNTSLVVKKVVLSSFDSALFRCDIAGGSLDYRYTTRLQIVGESLFVIINKYNANKTVSLFLKCCV